MPFRLKTIQSNSAYPGTDTHAAVPAHDFQKEFICPEESMRYAGSLEQLVFSKFRNNHSNPTIIEFGSGIGEPVISAILNSKFSGTVHGYEVNPDASEIADRLIEQYGLTQKYIVHNTSFFDSQRIPQSNYLIANPPYLPSKNRELLTLPDLYGGIEGNDISKQLLSCDYQNVFLEISSYSNPIALIEHSLSLGYKISDFLITQMSFGVYSLQDIVQERIHEMKKEGKAFYSKNCYLVGSAFFTKASSCKTNLSVEFLECLTSLGRI